MTGPRWSLRAAGAGALVLGMALPAAAMCSLTLRVENEGSFGVRIPLAEAQVRTRVDATPGFVGLSAWGPWRAAQSGGWFASATHRVLSPGESISDTYAADLPCLLAREFRVTFRCLGGPRQGQTRTTTAEIRGRLQGGSHVAWAGHRCDGS